MSISRLRSIENKAVNIFNDESKFRKYLDYVSETSSYRWYNSMIMYNTGKEIGSMNTESGWNKEGYSVKNESAGFDILVPKYKTEFVSNETGDTIDIKTITSDELGEALKSLLVTKRTYVSDLRDTRVFAACDVSSEHTDKNSVSEKDIENILSMLKYKYGVESAGLNEIARLKSSLSRAVIRVIGQMKKRRSIQALNIRVFENTMIISSVVYAVMKYIGVGYSDIDFSFLSSWVSGVDKRDYSDIVKLRCLDQINLICGKIIQDINEVSGVMSGSNEEIIDKNYNLNDLFKAAEADIINTQIHGDINK